MIKVDKPEIFQLELSSKCNLACIMCPHPILTQRAKEHLNFELFKTIIDRDALPQTKVIGLHLLGESLLHPQFLDMVKYMISKGKARVIEEFYIQGVSQSLADNVNGDSDRVYRYLARQDLTQVVGRYSLDELIEGGIIDG